jgi:uncharacterized protein (TIRG00374 family)
MKKNIIFILKLLVGLSVLIFLLYKLNFIEVYNTLISVNIYVILLVLIHLFITVFISTLNFKVLLIPLKVDIGLFKLLKYYLIAWAIGRFLPGMLGEVPIVYFFKKHGISYGAGTSIVILNKLITFGVLIIIGIFGFFMFYSKTMASWLTLFFISFVIFICFILFSSKVKILVKKYILRKYASKFTGFSKNLYYLIKKKKKILFLNLCLTVSRAILSAIILFVIFLLFNINISFWIILIINSIGILIALIPISISGLGIKEAGVIYFYSQVGVSPTIAGSIYLLIRFIGFIVAGIILIGSNSELLKWQK